MTRPTYYTTTIRTKRGEHWYDAPTITAGDARECLDAAMLVAPEAPSKLNPVFTREQSISIMRNALGDADDDEPIGHLHARNVLRLVQRRKRLKKPEVMP